MKILYSDLKKIIPGLKASPKQIGDFLTMAGFMSDGSEKISYREKSDFLLSFEIRHNRGDCLSVLGLAREVAAKWGLKTRLPSVESIHKLPLQKSQNIEVVDGRYVKRVIAYEIIGIKNAKSPHWLVDYLAQHDMNSKNLLVDFSNYVMLITGYPSHLLDIAKINGKLYWDMNKKFSTITTLDGTLIKLAKNKEIILRDNKNILALAGIVGGKRAELNMDTTSIIAESAIYHSGTVRQNATNLKIATEAGNRLSKYLDPNGLPYAMELLLTLIIENCGGAHTQIREFSYYPKKRTAPRIVFDPHKPSIYAGIEINKREVIKILLNLGFKVNQSGNNLIVVPPTGRMDVEIEEDVIEEVIRLYGFEKIPVNEIPAFEVVKDITPQVIKLSEKLRDVLVANGFDEILTSPLIRTEGNNNANYLNWQVVSSQNSVNEDYPDMRQSTAPGLVNQTREYQKKNLVVDKLFEIGTVFGKIRKKHVEFDSLGILCGNTSSLENARKQLETALRYVGINELTYQPAKIVPKIANPYACYDIRVKERVVGIIYQFKPEVLVKKNYFAEVNLFKLSDLLSKFRQMSVYELMQKIVTLDANLELEKGKPVARIIRQLKSRIGETKLWNIEIADAFPVKDKIKYTFRVSYMKLSDQEAKRLHLKVFKLNK